jgi:hypothetical protein
MVNVISCDCSNTEKSIATWVLIDLTYNIVHATTYLRDCCGIVRLLIDQFKLAQQRMYFEENIDL